MLITPIFKKSLIVEQFQGNYLKCIFSWVDNSISSVAVFVSWVQLLGVLTICELVGLIT